MEQSDKLLTNIKKLQDLKFEIYIRSHNKLDFHLFGLYTLRISSEMIDLSEWYSNYKADNSLVEIAELIIKKYQL